jgi:hypothetical protein
LFRRQRQVEEFVHHSPEDFWSALRGVWFAPGRFFKMLDPAGGPIRPALFASLILYLNLLFEAVLQAIWLGEFNYALIYAPFLGLVVALVLAPLLVAGLTTLVLVVLEGAPSRPRFVPLFRALGYATGIGFLLWVPFGPLLAIPYGALVSTIAVRETLNIGWARAAAAALIPLGAVLLIVLLLTGEFVTLLINPPGS